MHRCVGWGPTTWTFCCYTVSVPFPKAISYSMHWSDKTPCDRRPAVWEYRTPVEEVMRALDDVVSRMRMRLLMLESMMSPIICGSDPLI